MQCFPANLSSSAACSAAPPALPAKKGSWTEEEDEILLAYITKHGAGKWDEVARKCGLRRGGKSCRLRWKNQLHPRLKKEPFTVQEKQHVLHLHKQYGSKWSLIASHFPGRTDNGVKNICNSVKKRKQRTAAVPRNNIVQIIYPAAAPPSPPPPAPYNYGIPCRDELPSIQHDMSSPLMEEEDADFLNSMIQEYLNGGEVDQVPSVENLLTEPLRQPVDPNNTSAAGSAELDDVSFWNSLMQDLNGPAPLDQFADSDSFAADVNEMIPKEAVAAPVLHEWFPYNMDYEFMQQSSMNHDCPGGGYGFDDGELQQNLFPSSLMVDDDNCILVDDDLNWCRFNF